MNIKLFLQFDGTHYHGWQIQPNNITVQGELARVLKKLLGKDVIPTGCGRTDSGVHALSYVANFDAECRVPLERLPHAINANISEGIIVTKAEYAADNFSANRSAKGKTYRYTIDNGEFPSVFALRYAWHYKFPLDIDNMQKAAKAFIGTHDFIGFASSGFSVKTTVRTIYSVDISCHDSIITIDVSGNGFLYNMVRIIVGTLVYAGGGRIAPDKIPDIINSKCRERAGITAPAKGLCLKEVFY